MLEFLTMQVFLTNFASFFSHMKVTPAELPENIKKIREKWKLSQESFAALLQSTRGKIAQYEAGNNEPSLSFMILLQDYAQISINDLCRKNLKMTEILTNPAAGTFEAGKEKVYGENSQMGSVGDSAQESDIWYNYHFLVAKLKQFDERIKKIENKK